MLADGPNGISLIEAQRNFVEMGACHAESLPNGPHRATLARMCRRW
jgi:hypothetical protein